MIEETVEVVAIDGNFLTLEAQRRSSCRSCSVQKGCGTSVLSGSLGKKATRFHIENTVGAKVGDYLVVGIPENSFLKGSLVVYLTPLIGLFTAALSAESLLQDVASRDLWVSLCGLAGLLAGIGLSRLILSGLPRAEMQPVILRKDIGHVKLAR